jgi:hypothetical protein
VKKFSVRMLGFVCLTYTALLVIEALRLANTGQTPTVLILCALGMIFMISGTAALTAFGVDKSARIGYSLTLNFPDNVQKHMTEIAEIIGTTNMLDVIREALTVYDALAKSVTKDKSKIFIEYPDGRREEFEMLTPKTSDDKPNADVVTQPTDPVASQIR